MSQTLTYVIGQDRRPHVDNVQDFKVNFDGSNTNWVQARQYERSMRQVFVNIKNEDGTPLDLTGCNVWFEGLLPKNSAGDFRVIDDKGYVALDPTAGRFRFDMPGHAFTVAGSYRQAFFRILKDGNSITTLEFDLDVLADKVIDGLVPRTYISPVEELINEIEAKYQDSTDKLTKMTSAFVDKFTQSMNTLKGLGATVQNGLDALEQKIKQDGLFTQAEADAFKQAIEKELVSRIGDVNTFKAQGTSLTEKTLNEFSARAENVTWHGIIGDGKTDNTQALQNLSKWVDQQGEKRILYFPPGKYLWNETVQFNTPVVLTGTEDSWLKYTGTSDGLLLGPDGLTDDNYINYRSFTVKNLCFTGGDNSKYLIRFNKHITQGRVTDCQFHNAGGIADDSSCFCIWFSQNAWDGRVTGCQFDATAEAGRRQFVGMDEYGNSRIVIANNLVTSLTAKGVAILLNGYNCQAIGNKIEGFEVNIRLGAMASACEIAFNYFEKSGDNVSAAIQIGSLNPDVATYPTGIYIIGNYANLHNVKKEMWSYFIGPSNSNALIREMVVESNYVNAGNWNDPNDVRYGYLVLENNLPNQLGNRANNNYLGVGIKGIIDFNSQSKYEAWRGQDSNDHLWTPLDKDRPLTHDVMIPDDQALNLNVLDQKWRPQAQLKVDAYRNIILSTKTEPTAIEVFQNGQVAFGKGSAVTNYDFAHPLKATTIGVSQQVDDGDAGQLYEGKDGNLYYRNIAGERKKLTN
ncbi:BppU family phage baseplate upper protein [Limosilactobacillus reuteri]|uniref:BppU family phage baseplate upper protein n=1 Tax=Limosilactobacillus reuteri TaxID=1598 RepID=UPI001E4A8A17|nr:BppU family phage baseplate upper protein [Limosilactobacillus reuteri]MCC4398227.1 BppU family phage baseplate upper protein [Limosilactobacillus reuteri]MCC4409809.1 BppU family phage baseplate upper protein [Limosilactobacillus reuteri]